jgi:hypothetical protein
MAGRDGTGIQVSADLHNLKGSAHVSVSVDTGVALAALASLG